MEKYNEEYLSKEEKELAKKYFIDTKYPLNEFASDEMRFVYLVLNKINNTVKIGITNNIKNRINQLITQSGIKLELIISIQLQPEYDEPAEYIEKYLHNYFKQKRTIGEWFKLTSDEILAISFLFYEIGGEDIKDNTRLYFDKEISKRIELCDNYLNKIL